ncbi:hypothetical protein J3E68DRAFT_73143 [Trichoderma sp. SZMC 28012]
MRVRVIGERRKQQVLLYRTHCTEQHLHFAGTLLRFRICSSKRKHITSILYRIPLPGFYLQPVLFDSRQLHPVLWPGLALSLSPSLYCLLLVTPPSMLLIALGIFPKDTAVKSKPPPGHILDTSNKKLGALLPNARSLDSPLVPPCPGYLGCTKQSMCLVELRCCIRFPTS